MRCPNHPFGKPLPGRRGLAEGEGGWAEPACALRRPAPAAPQRLNVQFNNGEHGFDNQAMDMKTIFRAVGPSFRKGLEVGPFESVHVYELLCRLLGIVPEPNDGALSVLLPTLTPEAGGTPPPTPPAGEALASARPHSAARWLQAEVPARGGAWATGDRAPLPAAGAAHSLPVPGF